MIQVRQLARAALRNPRFAFLATATLAFGIGVNTAMFSIVNGVLLKPLPYHEPDRLVTISIHSPKLSHLYPSLPVSAYYVAEWQKQSRTVQEFALLLSWFSNLTSHGDAERLNAVFASSSLFRLLGVPPRLGRGFLPEEHQDGRHRVVVLSDALWRRRFGGDDRILDSTIELNGRPFQVIGVMPSGFPFPQRDEIHRMIPMPERVDLWAPMPVAPEETQRVRTHNYAAIARLRPGVSAGAAESELNEILRRLPGLSKSMSDVQARVAPLQADMVGRVERGLIVLMAAVGAVLLIVCVNLTNLMLTHVSGRRRELAVRTALGASRLRLCFQLLSENTLLAVAGAAGGILLANWLVDFIRVQLPVGLPRIAEVAVDVPAVLFASLLGFLCAAACGIVPAWRMSAVAPAEALKDAGRGSLVGRGAGRLRSALIACEVGMCVVLLVTSGLLINSFVRISAIDQGFRAGNVFVAEANLQGVRFQDAKAPEMFFRSAIDRVAAMPGVRAAAAASKLPLTGVSEVMFISAEGDPTPGQEAPQAEYRTVTPGYFVAMGIPVLRGRVFEDRPDGPPVAMIGERTAQRVWPNQDPVGRRFSMPGVTSITVAGVVADVRSTTPNSDPPFTVYRLFGQHTPRTMTFVIRTTGAEPPIRQAVKEIDASIPLSRIAKVEEIVDASVAARRFQMFLLSGFAGAALLLACLGVYGVVSFSVSQRHAEIGLRMALGARQADVVRLVLRDGMKPVLAGAALGLAGAAASARVVASLLYEVSPGDVVTFGLASAALIVVAMAACWLPANRAARIDPIATLHAD